jgi:phospholipid/cholesterol/gamma-HCH transport system substrate-binding protein
METRASYVTVGAFVLICVFGLFIAVLWLAGSQYREEYSYFRTYFIGAVTGLGRGTIVRYNGIDVGHVTDIGFDAANPRRVFVTLQTDPTLQIHVDSVTSIESQGLTGGVYVEIAGGTTTAPVLGPEPGQEYPVIPSKPSTLQQLTQAGPELVERFSTVGERLTDVLNDENRKSLTEMLDHLRSTTELIDRHSADLDATLGNFKVATEGVNRTLGNADRTLTSADRALTSIDRAVGTLDTTLNSADSTVKKLGQLTDDTDKIVNGQGVAQMMQLVAQTRALVASITRLANDLEREPTRLIFGDQRQGYTPK